MFDQDQQPERDLGEEPTPDDAPNEVAASQTDSPISETGRSRKSHSRGTEKSAEKTRKLTKKEVMALLVEKDLLIQELTEKSELLESEVESLKDKWLRSAAEFENYRKRTGKEWELLQQRTKTEVILEILNVLDDFERALSVAGEEDDDFTRGIRLIYNKLLSVLERTGVTRIEALDSPFDPTYHMAVSQLERKGANANHVIEVVQEGYLLGDTVIRPAKVVIAI